MTYLPGKQIEVGTWAELISALHSPDVIKHQPDEGGHLRSPYVFRGMDDANWGLLTSLQRLPKNSTTIEESLLRSFRKYAREGTFDHASQWYVLAVAQHNGLPTRCLDWTASPLVAAHFACGDFQFAKTDGAIWCLHVSLLREINRRSNPRGGGLEGVAWVYDTRLLEANFRDLAALDLSNEEGSVMLLWEPPCLDARIANQSGLLSIMNGGALSQLDFLKKHCEESPDLVLRIVISAEMKSEVRDMLDQNNISERTMYPGLPGLCAWLKRYYGAAW